MLNQEIKRSPAKKGEDDGMSCSDCFHRTMCGAFIDATRLTENFNAGWGKSVMLPMSPNDLARNCQQFCSSGKKNDIDP